MCIHLVLISKQHFIHYLFSITLPHGHRYDNLSIIVVIFFIILFKSAITHGDIEARKTPEMLEEFRNFAESDNFNQKSICTELIVFSLFSKLCKLTPRLPRSQTQFASNFANESVEFGELFSSSRRNRSAENGQPFNQRL